MNAYFSTDKAEVAIEGTVQNNAMHFIFSGGPNKEAKTLIFQSNDRKFSCENCEVHVFIRQLKALICMQKLYSLNSSLAHNE